MKLILAKLNYCVSNKGVNEPFSSCSNNGITRSVALDKVTPLYELLHPHTDHFEPLKCITVSLLDYFIELFLSFLLPVFIKRNC